MRIASGVTDEYIYFVALSSTDGSRLTGLSSFTVYRSRNGGAATAMTTPTINETSSANMPGIYELLLDEDMTIDSGDYTQAMVFHITATGMQPVTREIELFSPAQIIDDLWDEVLTGATHNVPSSAGRRLRQLTNVVIHDGTAQGFGTGTNQIQLDTGASSTNGAYDPAMVAIVGGTGAGQSRIILQYVGSTRMATVDRDWRVLPDATSEFIILAHEGREHVNEGLAQGGTSTTIILNVDASDDDDEYNGQLVFIRSGEGADQVRLVTDYDGGTHTATVATAWTTTPTTQSGYVMVPDQAYTLAQINAEVDTALSDYDGPTNAEMVARTLLAADYATATALATVDTVVDAVKLKTDGLTFTVAGQVDANAESMNGAEILGDGTSGNLWRGA